MKLNSFPIFESKMDGAEEFYRQLREEGKDSEEALKEVMKKFDLDRDEAFAAVGDAMQVTEKKEMDDARLKIIATIIKRYIDSEAIGNIDDIEVLQKFCDEVLETI